MLTNKAFCETVSSVLKKAVTNRYLIVIEHLKFIDDEFWINYRFGSCLKMYCEKVQDVYASQDQSVFWEHQYAKLSRYLIYSQIYHELVKHQSSEQKQKFVADILKEANHDF
ncbi:hypothetical protein D5018_19955 [Parashewanella curva]|uniref:Uncharacterized protein n=1 Tax=Parashewanella curva TaxID=2338552 RepID=A0A3L8PRB8_9GAMM|nr:hypothetical protein [Parashewanella curva]RLV57930.1 hypothetical protein D5018_19955 [Parashewanella curva]